MHIIPNNFQTSCPDSIKFSSCIVSGNFFNLQFGSFLRLIRGPEYPADIWGTDNMGEHKIMWQQSFCIYKYILLWLSLSLHLLSCYYYYFIFNIKLWKKKNQFAKNRWSQYVNCDLLFLLPWFSWSTSSHTNKLMLVC